MEWIAWVALALLIMSGLAAGLALGAHLLLPRSSERARILWSAGIAGVLPMSLAFAGFLSEARVPDEDFGMSLLALVVLQLVILAVFCLPAAWFTTTRLGGTPDTQPLLGEDAPDLVEG